MTQTEKGKIFRALHQGAGTFLLPNPWDIGTARLLAALGYHQRRTRILHGTAGQYPQSGHGDGARSFDRVGN
jgi:2-methylisocitrate lyase-like PEP mutase family enzyme